MIQALTAYGKNTFSSLSIRNYRLFFIGQCVSMSGTWMQTVALGWLVLELTSSGAQLGLVTAMQFVPMLFFGAYGGVIADKLNKRSIMYWTQALAGVVCGIVGFLVIFGMVKVWMLYVLALALGIIRVFENPARQALVYDMVGSDYIKNAVSLNATANNLARAIGPSIGGFLIAGVGIGFCFIFNALSYIGILITLHMMRSSEFYESVVEKDSKDSGNLMDGLRYVAGNAVIRDTLIIMAVIGTFAYEFQVSLPILAQQTFLGDASAYAALFAAFGAGSAIGGIFSAGRQEIAPKHLVLAILLFGTSTLGTAFAPTLLVAIFGMAVVGIFSINVISLANTTIQLESAPNMRGRVMALWSVAMIGSTPIGGPIVGWVGEYFGGRWGLAIGGVATVATAYFAYKRLRDKQRVDAELPAAIENSEVTIERIKVR